MIRKAATVNVDDKKIRILIAGYPGIGKSTLALSAPKPLHIDVDHGIDRIEPRYRADYIQPQSYDEILEDLKPETVQDYETLVFDTGGKLISLMSLWAIKKDPKNAKRDGSLAIQGYGVIKREFNRLMDYCHYDLKKHIVIIFHAKEEKDDDKTRLRIKVEGGTKEDVWEPMDLGGFVEMNGNERTIGFSNCEKYFAKGTRGVNGVHRIPALGPGSANDFLTKLFEQYNAKSAEELAVQQAQQKVYNDAIEAASLLIQSVTDAESANATFPSLKDIKHALTSEREVAIAWNKHIKGLGLFFDPVLKEYTQKPEDPKGDK